MVFFAMPMPTAVFGKKGGKKEEREKRGGWHGGRTWPLPNPRLDQPRPCGEKRGMWRKGMSPTINSAAHCRSPPDPVKRERRRKGGKRGEGGRERRINRRGPRSRRRLKHFSNINLNALKKGEGGG